MSLSSTQHGHVLPENLDESNGTDAETKQVDEAELDDVNGGISLPPQPLPYILPA